MQTLNAIGAFSAGISGFDPSQTIYYRVVIDGDGRHYSASSTFVSGGGIIAGFNILNAVVVPAYIAMIIFTVIILGRKSTIVALLFMALAIYVGEACITLIQEALNNVFGG